MSGYIYAIAAQDAVKIGWASEPRRRLSELNVASPQKLELIGVRHGSRDDEAEIHASCEAERIRGEWFRKSGPVIDFLQSLIPFPKPQRPVAPIGHARTFREIIDQVGIPTLAKALSVAESHVRTMKARDSISPEYWSALIEEAAHRGIPGVTYESLMSCRGARFRRNEAAA